jgi:hypothetical protein
MGMLRWIMRKGPTGKLARDIGECYAQIKRDNPEWSPEEIARMVSLPHIYNVEEYKLYSSVCYLIEKQTGKDPSMDYIGGP